VRALQRLLTHSYSGKALAIKRVTENRGRRTAGVDGETWSTSLQKVTAIRRLQQRGYKSLPLRRVYILKKHSPKLRPLSIVSIDYYIWHALFRWAKRRHPRKPSAWVWRK
jgi:RNA-directed DNA polymerase